MGQDVSQHRPEEWIVAFIGGDGPWWHFPLRRGFRHVLALRYISELKCWVLFEPAFEGIRVEAMSAARVNDLIAEVWRNEGRFLRVVAGEHVIRRPLFFCSCVTAMKRVLRVGGCALSPWQLYRYLLRNGAQPVFERGDDDGKSARTEL